MSSPDQQLALLRQAAENVDDYHAGRRRHHEAATADQDTDAFTLAGGVVGVLVAETRARTYRLAVERAEDVLQAGDGDEAAVEAVLAWIDATRAEILGPEASDALPRTDETADSDGHPGAEPVDAELQQTIVEDLEQVQAHAVLTGLQAVRGTLTRGW